VTALSNSLVLAIELFSSNLLSILWSPDIIFPNQKFK
jgi:hypothetical protein